MAGIAVTDAATARLPAQFAAFERFADWILPDELARSRKRAASTMAELRAFYDAMLPEVEAMLAHLDAHELDALPPAEGRLLELLLGLVEIANAVELYFSPELRYGFPVERFRPEHELAHAGRR
jgi:hypothetical protein